MPAAATCPMESSLVLCCTTESCTASRGWHKLDSAIVVGSSVRPLARRTKQQYSVALNDRKQ